MFNFNLVKLRISSFDEVNKINRSLDVENVRFSISQASNILALKGESGLGKTTVFRSIFSNYVKYWRQGDIFEFDCSHVFNDINFTHENIIKGDKNKDLNFGFATQIPYFFNNKSVYDNLFGPLKWKKIKMDKTKREKYVRLFGLDQNDLINAKMGELSGGQRQVINIARMLVVSPQLAIIDECFSNMDYEMANNYIKLIKKNFQNCYFIVTSHRSFDIESFGAKIVNLKREYYETGKQFVTMEKVQ